MQIRLENFRGNPVNFMRQAGYAFDRNEDAEMSFVRRISGDYPRLHAYSHLEDTTLVINLHLDQKRPTYQAGRAHSGEYDSPLVMAEGERIKSLHR